ncbi:MAG: 3-oxoacyl-[acyl-carrier-protein] reductase [Chloroflexi bacterium]|nr:3-oxoacyl-[acyl-carrier-protein] reductase [Chloroflexota bacterium]MQG05253.1 3-oxoacyl-[acyl-carrier-protein] reductase [SAR202 cluster bacterium]
MTEKPKTALITGGAKGLGRAVAVALAKEGINVIINYKSSKVEADDVAKRIQNDGGVARTIQFDVADVSQVDAKIKEVSEEVGGIDILVNNAGIIQDGLVLRMDNSSWANVIETNLSGAFFCSRAVLRKMVSNRWGRIINIGSVVGDRGNAGQVNYSASKAGLIGFTKALSKELAARNITVNIVNPGYVETETTSVLTEQQKNQWLSLIPVGRFGESEEIANLVAFLASNKASYITGQVIAIDGGLSV